MAESDLLEYALLSFEAGSFGASVNLGKVPSNDYPCSLGTIGFGARLVAGGFSPHSETTVVIRKSILPVGLVLKTGQAAIVTQGDGTVRNLKIAKEGIRDCIYAWELTCDDANEAA